MDLAKHGLRVKPLEWQFSHVENTYRAYVGFGGIYFLWWTPDGWAASATTSVGMKGSNHHTVEAAKAAAQADYEARIIAALEPTPT